MTQQALVHRIIRLESTRFPSPPCPDCHGSAVRVVYVDPGSEQPWHESLPASGCPACGNAVSQTYHIMIANDGTMPALG